MNTKSLFAVSSLGFQIALPSTLSLLTFHQFHLLEIVTPPHGITAALF
jgi:hypothetical protein